MAYFTFYFMKSQSCTFNFAQNTLFFFNNECPGLSIDIEKAFNIKRKYKVTPKNRKSNFLYC